MPALHGWLARVRANLTSHSPQLLRPGICSLICLTAQHSCACRFSSYARTTCLCLKKNQERICTTDTPTSISLLSISLSRQALQLLFGSFEFLLFFRLCRGSTLFVCKNAFCQAVRSLSSCRRSLFVRPWGESSCL